MTGPDLAVPGGDPPVFLLPDINECEVITAVCGKAFCENVEGTFLCICSGDDEEFDPESSQCRSRALMGRDSYSAAFRLISWVQNRMAGLRVVHLTRHPAAVFDFSKLLIIPED